VKKIAYIVPGTGLSDVEIERRESILNSVAGGGFYYHIKTVANGPSSIESFYDEYVSVPGTLELVREVEQEGYAAVIIGCFGDPGIEAARELVDIPVIGPGEASLLLASSLGESLSIITILRNVVNPLKRLVHRLGLRDRVASIRAIDIPVLQIVNNREVTASRMMEEGRKAVENDGADTLVLGCMSEGFLGIAEEMSNAIGVPVVNPVTASVKWAEMLVSAGLKHSKRAYPHPPKTVITRLR
jgi:allantoin racemase